MMKRPGKHFLADGVRFECVPGCVKCCAIPGVVYVFGEEIPALAAHFGISVDEFIEQRLRHHWADVYEFNFPSDEPCIYLNETGCEIYDVRPLQCSTFPFWPENIRNASVWRGVRKMCPGIGRGRTHVLEEVRRVADKISMGPFL